MFTACLIRSGFDAGTLRRSDFGDAFGTLANLHAADVSPAPHADWPIALVTIGHRAAALGSTVCATAATTATKVRRILFQCADGSAKVALTAELGVVFGLADAVNWRVHAQSAALRNAPSPLLELKGSSVTLQPGNNETYFATASAFASR